MPIHVQDKRGETIPFGALYTDPGAVRSCTRCGHFECPCCGDWCDQCFDLPDSDRELDPEAGPHHPVCADQLQCLYDRVISPDLLELVRRAHALWSEKCSFGTIPFFTSSTLPDGTLYACPEKDAPIEPASPGDPR
jgi:hypothetical protein